VTTSDSSHEFIWIGSPGEWVGITVCLCDEAFDGDLQINDRLEDAALEATLRKFGEKSFNCIEPGARSRREVEYKSRVPVKPPGARSDACERHSC
jgi:hypothetical protein